MTQFLPKKTECRFSFVRRGLHWETIPAAEEHTTKQCGKDPRKLLQALREVEQAIARNEAVFNMLTEDELLDACILERKALERRYAYYLRVARGQGLCCSAAQLAGFALQNR